MTKCNECGVDLEEQERAKSLLAAIQEVFDLHEANAPEIFAVCHIWLEALVTEGGMNGAPKHIRDAAGAFLLALRRDLQ